MFRRNMFLVLFLILLTLILSNFIFAAPLDLGTKSETFSLKVEEINYSKISVSKADLPIPLEKLSTNLLGLLSDDYIHPGMTRKTLQEQMRSYNQFAPAGEITSLFSERPAKDLVYVYIYLNDSESIPLVKPFVWKGLEGITDRNDLSGLIVAWVPVDNLGELAALDEVRTIRTVTPPITRSGSVTSEGDALHRADLARATFGHDGRGIKVGVIADGVDNWHTARASGDLPDSLTVLSNNVGGDEGTAMLEIIHDIAPGADLYFHDSGDNILSFNNAISALVSAGCQVIIDDIGWIMEPFFEDGIIARHVTSVIDDHDLVYISAAGNDADRHYQGFFYEDPDFEGSWHDFSHGNSEDKDLYAEVYPGETITVVLQWDDPFGGSANDYDLYLYDYSSMSILAESENHQDGTGDPLEFISFTNTGSEAIDVGVAVMKFDGHPRELEVFIYDVFVYPDNIVPHDSIFGHPAVPQAVAVGAIDTDRPDIIADYSSLGPSTIRHPSSETRNKPDICGIAGVKVTGAGGFPLPFYGTSAAAPHIAAIAALSWSANPDKTGEQIRQTLLNTASDMGTRGFNYIYGYGLADAYNAISAIGLTFSDVPSTHPFYDEINAVAAAGITTGYEDGTFKPSDNVTRMAMAAFLYRGLGLEDASVTVPSFSDVPANHPFFTEIEALAASGITTGYEDGTFKPSAEVTRMAMAAFLYRGLGLEDADVTVPSFSDVPANHPFFTEIEALAASGITTGFEDGTFRPSAIVTRMATAAFLYRGLGLDAHPNFDVFPESDIWGDRWQANTEIKITIDDGADENIYYRSSNETGHFQLQFDGVIEVQAGYEVTVDDGVTEMTHTVKHLVIIAVDLDENKVYGKAEPNAKLDVGVHEAGSVDVIADGAGNWHADLQTIHDITYGDMVFAFDRDAMGNATGFEWHVSDPSDAYFSVNPRWNDMCGHESWPANTELTVTVGDPSAPDWTGTVQTDHRGDFYLSLWSEYDIEVGDQVSVSDGTITRTHQVELLRITEVDYDNDIVYGKAVPNRKDVDVIIHKDDDHHHSPMLLVDADHNGDWTADFSGTISIEPDYEIHSHVRDTERNGTFAGWSEPDTRISVNPVQNIIGGSDWAPEEDLTVIIAGGADYSNTVQTSTWGDWELDLDGIFDIQPDYIITAVQGDVTSTHVVRNLAVTAVNEAANSVSGTADPGSEVRALIVGEHFEIVIVTADGTGLWTAEFSYNIGPDSGGYATQYDDTVNYKGNHTWLEWPEDITGE